MHLRQSIATPDRFDEVIFKTKRKDAIKPAYPALLASQIVPFDPEHQLAAFPSLPLTYNPSRKHTNLEDCCAASPLSTQRPTHNSETVAPNQSYDIDHVMTSSSTGTGENDADAGAETCGSCNKEFRVEWQSLPLPVQMHIFNSFLLHQHSPEAVATDLKLTYQELDLIQKQVVYRRIYCPPLETVWYYAAATSDLGPGIIDPDTLPNFMNYLVRASHYENTDEDGVQRGRLFLQQSGFDDVMMDDFGEEGSRSKSKSKFKPNRTLSATTTQPRSSVKRRKSSSNGLRIDVLRANSSTKSRPGPATAPANVTSSRAAVEILNRESLACNNNSSADATSQERSGNNFLLQSKRIRLDVDRQGHASVSHEPDNGGAGLAELLSSQRLQHDRDRDQPFEVSQRTMPTTRPHPSHNSRAFATHFDHRHFPALEKSRLLLQSPRKMSRLEHWLVYGTFWVYLDHLVDNGPVQKPANISYDPRKTPFDEDRVPWPELRQLIALHNEWVCNKNWFAESYASLLHDFTLATERMLGSNLNVPEQKDSDTIASTMLERTKRSGCLPSEELPMRQGSITDDGELKTDIRRVPEPKTQETNTASHSISNELQKTPNDRSLPSHTGDTTVGILSSSPSKVDSISHENCILENENAFAKHDEASDTAPLVAENVCRADEKKKSTGSRQTNAPSYSPISDQDPGTLPAWALFQKDREACEDTANVPSRSGTLHLGFGTNPASSIHQNQFLQDLLKAAAEDQIESSNKLNAHPLLAKSPTPIEQHYLTDNERMVRENLPKHFRTSFPPGLPSNIRHDTVGSQTTTANMETVLPNQQLPHQALTQLVSHEQPRNAASQPAGFETAASSEKDFKVNSDFNLHFPTMSRVQVNVPIRNAKVSQSSSVRNEQQTTINKVGMKSPGYHTTNNTTAKFQIANGQENPAANAGANANNKTTSKSKAAPAVASKVRNRASSLSTATKKTFKPKPRPTSKANRPLNSTTTTLPARPAHSPNPAADTSTPKKRRKDFGTKRAAYKKRTPKKVAPSSSSP